MTLVETTAPAQTKAISFEVDLPCSPAKVWRALTEPELLAEWLLPTIGLKLEIGAEFALQAQAFPDWDGKVKCRLLELEQHKKLSYSWSVPFLETTVTFTLAPTPVGTRLSILQEGFDEEQKRELGGSRYGWNMMGKKLIALLERLP